MSHVKLKYLQWVLGGVCVVAALSFALIPGWSELGEEFSKELANVQKLAWGVFGVSLMGSVGLKAYRDYLEKNSGKVAMAVQVLVSIAGMLCAIYIAWNFGK